MDELREVLLHFTSQSKTSQSSQIFNVRITEILTPSDPRTQSEEVKAAKRKELNGLIRRGTWKVVLHDEVPDKANVMICGFILTIKDTETDEPKFKARFVIHGHKDRENFNWYTQVKTSSTLPPVYSSHWKHVLDLGYGARTYPRLTSNRQANSSGRSISNQERTFN